MGTGHVMRCLALAQSWMDLARGRAAFAVHALPDALERRLVREGLDILRIPSEGAGDAGETSRLSRDLGAEWIVADGYHFGTAYYRSLRDDGGRVLVFDDGGGSDFQGADAVVNQNLFADRSLYPEWTGFARLLLGCRYVQLRREFRRWIGWTRTVEKEARRILVTLGGSDPENVTTRVIEALCHAVSAHCEVTVVIGAGSSHLAVVKDVVESSGRNIRVLHDVQDMSELMVWADLAIAAGGTTSWELLFLGVPSVTLELAPNQAPVAHSLRGAGLTLAPGNGSVANGQEILEAIRDLAGNFELRRQQAEAGQRTVDGRGCERLVNAMGGATLNLRDVEPRDCRLLFKWANDRETRSASFSSDPISWDRHQAWFASKLNDTECAFFIAENSGGEPIGQARFELNGLEATISISLDVAHRGVGYGERLLSASADRLFAERGVNHFHAFVKPENAASSRTFERAGYKKCRSVIVHGQSADPFVLRRGAV